MITGYTKFLAALMPVCILLASTCKETGVEGSIKAELNKPVALSLTEKAIFSSDSLLVEVSEINDSRCPANVTCITAGSAKVRIAVSGAGSEKNVFSLCIGHCDNRNQETDQAVFQNGKLSYSVTLKGVEPYPGTSDKIKKAVIIVNRL